MLFDRLCECIIAKVGETSFKSQEWLLSREATKPPTYHATNALGGILSGEVKIAIMLRLMAGASSYLDVLLTYGSSTGCFCVFGVPQSTCLDTLDVSISFVKWIVSKDEAALNSVAEGFLSASGGVFRKCIGALDGLAIKIKCPVASNLISDPGNYFCRKGFYPLNVQQAICDKSRRVLWMSAGHHKGSTHDSTAFLETQLFKILEDSSDWLHNKGYFLVGDSAYPLMGHLMVPYSDAKSLSLPDNWPSIFGILTAESKLNVHLAKS